MTPFQLLDVLTLVRAFLDRYWSLEILLQLSIPIVLIVYPLPRRSHYLLRAAVSIVGFVLLAVVPIATGTVVGLDELESFATFSLLLVLYVLAIAAVYEVGIWQALFCATAAYTIQNLTSGAVVLAQLALAHRAIPVLSITDQAVTSLGIPALVYALFYLFFVRPVTRNGLVEVENRLMLLEFVFVVFVIIGLDILIKGALWDGITFMRLVMFRLVHTLVCCFVLFTEYELLYAKRVEGEKAMAERLLVERERQYRISRQNIDAINIKCHDIRHQIRQLAGRGGSIDESTLADIAREVSVYDSVVETGNEALDTILTEKSLACRGEGITLSCIADGAALGFMAASDIYSLFGNALDNATEATREMEDPDRRTITLNVTRKGSMVAINVENYFDRELRLNDDGLPVTHKPDVANHGFGMRSMRQTVERYGGMLHVGSDGQIFYLNILIPAQ